MLSRVDRALVPPPQCMSQFKFVDRNVPNRGHWPPSRSFSKGEKFFLLPALIGRCLPINGGSSASRRRV